MAFGLCPRLRGAPLVPSRVHVTPDEVFGSDTGMKSELLLLSDFRFASLISSRLVNQNASLGMVLAL